jgi:uncharacterized protein YutE (UPF0331/DUF86 family)
MIKPNVVLRLLDSLKRHVEALRPLQRESLAALTADKLRWNGVLHLLQLSVEHVMDISNHLLAGTQRMVPDDGRESIRELGRDIGVLPYEFAERIAPMAGLRNILVHEYMTVDPLIIHGALQHGLDDFEEFARHVYDYLRREGHLPATE